MLSNCLKLYEAKGSPNSRRVRIFLAEKGISVNMVPVDLGVKEQFSEAYRTHFAHDDLIFAALGINIDFAPYDDLHAIFWRYF